MPRPCYCDKIEFNEKYNVQKHCRLCWLYHNNSDYKKMWDMPTTEQQIKNIFSAIKKRVENNFQNVDKKTYEDRLKICEKCEKKTSDWRCTACGCFLNLKAEWASEDCPEGKWPLPVLTEKTKEECDCGK